MAKFNVVDMNGQHVSEIELSDAVFGITPNEKAVHIAVVNFLANQRQGTQNTKIRMEVSGGGKKPWRQKGTGRARAGYKGSPVWRRRYSGSECQGIRSIHEHNGFKWRKEDRQRCYQQCSNRSQRQHLEADLPSDNIKNCRNLRLWKKAEQQHHRRRWISSAG